MATDAGESGRKAMIQETFVPACAPNCQAEEAEFRFQVLQQRVDTYLERLNLPQHGSARMVFKSLAIVGTWCLAYLLLLLFGMASVPAAIATLLFLALASLALQLGVMHDASHYAITNARWPNTLLRLTLPLIGGSSVIWYRNHVVAHHSHSNIEGHDPDINTAGLLRFHDQAPWHFWNRWQHLYAIPLYALHALQWVWWSDAVALITNSHHLSGGKRALLFLELVLSRLSHIVLFLVVPYLILGSWLPVLAGYFAFMLLFGGAMTVIFALAHIADVQEFMTEKRSQSDDWALHQLRTTSDFSVGNGLLTFLIGGLNFQVEHHIFPKLSHLHLAKIQPLVREYCREKGVPYHEFPSVWSALCAHLRQLKRCAQAPSGRRTAAAGSP